MKKVFIINGAAGVGKDTFVEIAKYKIFIKTGLPTYNISSVDNVKTAAKILGWDGEKDARGRKFLSDLKDLSTTNYQGPYNYMLDQVNTKTKGIFFLHIREPSEIKYFVDNYCDKVETIIVKRDNIETFENHADKNVDNFNYDYIILNVGSIEDLVNVVDKFIERELNND